MQSPNLDPKFILFVGYVLNHIVADASDIIARYDPFSADGKELVDIALPLGQIRGVRRRGEYDIGSGAVTDTIEQYLGVPYARPPVGNLRFKPPVPPLPWGGVLNATKPGWSCPQKSYYTQTKVEKQSEDCLYLNIYSPNANGGRERYPVMVFIHGGSYEEGSGIRYDGYCLAAHGVVVVTINYRLGVLGYLSSGDDGLPGNYGLLDQIEALSWIRQNIGHFRGDPNHVTIFGSSAGASSVGLLLMTPKSKGLIHSAIIQSGPPISFWAVHNSSVNHAAFTRQVAKRVGCQSEAMADIIECLRKAPVEDFIKYHWQFPRISPSALNFKPRVDGDVLVEMPKVALASGRHHHVPVLIGVVEEEWARSMGWFYRELTEIDKEYTDGLERSTFEKSVEHVLTQRLWWPKSVSDVVTHAYTDWKHVNDPMHNRANYINFMSDMTMVAPSVGTANILSKQEVPVYMYRFNHRSIHTEPEWWGVYHSLELDYVFGSPFLGYDIAVDKWVNHTEEDRTLSRKIMKMWTSFATFSSPTPNATSDVPKWKRFHSKTSNYMYITASKFSNREHLRAEKMALWNNLIPKLLPESIFLSRVHSPGVPISKLNYQLLAWVFLASSLSFFISFVVVVWRLLALRSRQNGNDRRYYNGQPPQMV